jgi:hypothetical protein
MRAITLYLDTSVLGGYYDDEFADATKELWRQADDRPFNCAQSPSSAKAPTQLF